MAGLRVLAATARTLSLLVAPEGTRFALPAPTSWTLRDAAGEPVARGEARVVPLFLEGLEPDSAYRLETDIGGLDLRTLPCTGLIDATDFGVDTQSPDNAEALGRAIAAVPTGGTLRLTPGRYTSGPVFLKPQMTLHLAEGAELAAKADRTGWPILPERTADGRVLGTWEGLPEPCFAALLTAIDCYGLAITGRGVIDGGGDRGDWWHWAKERRDGARRPRTLHLAHCNGVRLTGLTIRNSPSWTLHPYGCRQLHASALRIENPPDSPNTDGFNPESCEAVEITGVDFSVGDDCIAIKAGKRAPGQTDHLSPTRDVRISHCRMQRGHGAVVLGSEMSGGIYDVEIADCAFNATDRGLRLKTRRGRGGAIEGVHMRNVEMWDVPTPLAINGFYFCDPDGKEDWVQNRAPAPVDETTPVLRGITLSNVCAHGVSLAAAAVLGLPEAPIEAVRLQDFRVSYRPDAIADVPLMALGVEAVRHGGLLAENAEVSGTVTCFTEDEDVAPC
ncbi:polygalacturonase PglA [Aliiruegeria sabulilitoris]|uniref:polygalacturonase PglA n=1 Tax=Aliiruegeria sabulilitoris TaxID=1510458 RepID=UPI00082EFBCF|nr:glycoside hydrolase family 28 protein [Aliiruegeria sabulilitoris]NDR55723.1 glycoside hydrolase family 28 protein [Pseudoruegeria sp. M32A2M]